MAYITIILRFYYGEFKDFEILNIYDFNKNDFNIDIKIYFEKSHAFYYKKIQIMILKYYLKKI